VVEAGGVTHNGPSWSSKVPKIISFVVVTLLFTGHLAACAPAVGSERWCAAMRDKPRGDWSANEALDFTRHCLLDTRD
jgi:hypothetical protein